ncbi:uncharacterized protein LOC105171743 [Sesamum indicum]|uniref:Uncharacterized protein LOC105171743 n=1 Tax=Sesamum indicum TaxID=4182 RepID=A0A8M8V9D4_SESIN|nr:uncharacterized protein LOC105171743 [Sesamum indicum]
MASEMAGRNFRLRGRRPGRSLRAGCRGSGRFGLTASRSKAGRDAGNFTSQILHFRNRRRIQVDNFRWKRPAKSRDSHH